MRANAGLVSTNEEKNAVVVPAKFWLWGLILPLIVYAARALLVLLDPHVSYDTEYTYLPLARKLIANAGSVFSSVDALRTAPGTYVYMALAGADIPSIKMWNLVGALSVVVMLFDTARRTAGPVAGAIAAWLLALSPLLIELSVYPMVEPPSLFLLTLWIWATAWAIDSKRPIFPILLAGLALSAATLTRATTMYWIPAIALLCAMAYFVPRLKAMHVPWARIATIHLIALLCVGAYIARNAVEFGKPAIATGSGAALYFGNLQLSHGQEPPFVGLQHDEWSVLHGAPSHLSIEGDQRLNEAVRTIVGSTSLQDLASFYVRKAGTILFFSKSHLKNYSDRLWRILLIGLAVAGLWMGRSKPMVKFTGLLLLYMVAVHIPVLYNPRYSIVALDIELTLLAGIGVGLAWQHMQRWRVIAVLAFTVLAAAIAGAAHQRYSSAYMADFNATPLPLKLMANPNDLHTKGFSGDPFEQLVGFTDEVGKIEWDTQFPEADGFTLLHLKINELHGECTKAWMGYTNAAGVQRHMYMHIQSLKNGQDFTRGLLHIFSPGTGAKLTLAFQCSPGTQVRFGSMGLYTGSSGLHYRALMDRK